MKDFIDLCAELFIELSDHVVGQRSRDAIDAAGGIEQRRNKGLDALLGDGVGFVAGTNLRGFKQLVDQGTTFCSCSGGFLLCAFFAHFLRSVDYLSSIPSSFSKRSRVASSCTSACSFLRKSGMLPSGPLSALSAPRSSTMLRSSGTLSTMLSGWKSARDSNLRLTGRLSSEPGSRRLGTERSRERF